MISAAVALLSLALAVTVVRLVRARRRLRALAALTCDIVRDPQRRLRLLDESPDSGERELARWIDALAEQVQVATAAHTRERALLAAVADGLTQGVIAVDGAHRIELLNDAARAMLGVTSPLVGEPLLEFVRVPELRELVESSVASTAEILLPSGVRALVRVARKSPYGEASRWGGEGRVLLVEDVTAMRRLETVRRDFVANVSHELRTPVAVIRANAETLMAGAQHDLKMAPKLIDGLHRNAERLARILADLLDLSRLDAGQYRLELAPVAVMHVTEQSLTAVEPQAAKRNVRVHLEIAEAVTVLADAKALDQILVNLIDNAVKYTRASGNVWVEARADGENVRIEVRDDGPGIAAKHRERVFERFYRADPSRSREAGGTGLGLSIVKHLVESMGGEVGVEANPPQGCIFWLRLARASAVTAVA